MLALYRSGRRADAVAAYRMLFERLVELGLEPDEESRRLERQMLQRAPELAVVEPARTNVGARLTSFVGREADQSLVRERFGEHRLVTLTWTWRCGQDEPCSGDGAQRCRARGRRVARRAGADP
jgi:DNA-binding SARP family transcriptional activator